MELLILPTNLLEEYKTLVSGDALSIAFSQLEDAELSTDGFSFYTSVASVYSSKIEGETIELDSYIKHKRFGIEFLPDYTRKIDDLYLTYQFAKDATPNNEHIAKAHILLSQHIVAKNWQSKFRNQDMYVTTEDDVVDRQKRSQTMLPHFI
jgi:hypothetical protein